jgi:hypothetical protein
MKPRKLPLIAGIGLLVLWAAWGLTATLASSDQVTPAYAHYICQRGEILGPLAPLGCSKLSELYLLAHWAFWGGVALLAWYAATRWHSQRKPR